MRRGRAISSNHNATSITQDSYTTIPASFSSSPSNSYDEELGGLTTAPTTSTTHSSTHTYNHPTTNNKYNVHEYEPVSSSTENYYLEYYNTMQKSNFISDQNIARDQSQRIRKARILTGCAYFSFVGVLFLLFIGILIETQPIYIKGLHKRRAKARMNYINTYQKSMANQKLNSPPLPPKSNEYQSKEKHQQTQRRLSQYPNYWKDLFTNLASFYYILASSSPSSSSSSSPPLPQQLTQQLTQEVTEMYGSVRRRLENSHVFVESANAFKAAFAYFCTMIFCLAYKRYGEQIIVRWNRWRRFAPYREVSGIGSHYIFKDSQRRGGYGTFGKWKQKMGIQKWFKKDDKSKKR